MSSSIDIINNDLNNNIIDIYKEESISLMFEKMLNKLRIISKNTQ
jgi:hypothetical protein